MSEPAADRLDEIEADLETLARTLRRLERELGGEAFGERLDALERRLTAVHAEAVRRCGELETKVAALTARLAEVETSARPTDGADSC